MGTMFSLEIRSAIQKELDAAETARLSGLPGKSRVCARRAAGVAARTYCSLKGIQYKDPNAIQVLELLFLRDDIPAPTKLRIQKLIEQVDTNYSLPDGYDLEIEAAALVTDLQALL